MGVGGRFLSERFLSRVARYQSDGAGHGPLPSEAIGILRGGAWNNDRRAVRTSYRYGYFQRHVGFETTIRCAMNG